MGSKSIVLVFVVTVMSCVLAAPKPVDWQEVQRKIKGFGEQALPAIRGICGFVNSYQGFPQRIPQYPTYPQGPYQGYYPPTTYYPGSEGRVPVFSNTPLNNGAVPPKGASEQDDLNRSITSFNFAPRSVSPQVQDVFNNVDRVPKINFVPGNALKEEQFRRYKGED